MINHNEVGKDEEKQADEQSVKNDPNISKLTRFGIKYHPPTLMVEYTKPDSQGNSKIYHHNIEFHQDALNSMTVDYVEEELYPNLSKTLESLVELPKDGTKAICLKKMKKLVSKLFHTNSNRTTSVYTKDLDSMSNLNLNMLSDEVLNHVKNDMDKLFEAHKVDWNAKDYVYDKRVDFDEILSNSSWD